jgi:hypothetical protein
MSHIKFLLRAVLALFQLQGASNHADVRTAGFVSLACAFLSCTYSCLLLISFNALKVANKAQSHADTELGNRDENVTDTSTEANTLVWKMVSIREFSNHVTIC